MGRKVTSENFGENIGSDADLGRKCIGCGVVEERMGESVDRNILQMLMDF